MEKKLNEYRARKAREEKLNRIKSKSLEIFGKLFKKRMDESEKLLVEDEEQEIIEEQIEEEVCCSWTDLIFYGLCLLLWGIVYLIFIELQFGTVYLVLSGIAFIFLNTRTRPRRIGEVSAYSVFNENCTSIDGTLKAEQFEKEIRQ